MKIKVNNFESQNAGLFGIEWTRGKICVQSDWVFIKFCDVAATCPCSPTAQTTVVTVFSVYYKWLNSMDNNTIAHR